jgi:hypothetical protein
VPNQAAWIFKKRKKEKRKEKLKREIKKENISHPIPAQHWPEEFQEIELGRKIGR